MKSVKKLTVHVVSLTHWDREWYSTFQQFRYRLIEMTDEMLDTLENTPGYNYFVFDGQTVVMEDYLEIRPENKDRLKKLVKDGKLQIGPWYVLCDEFLVSAESFIRNLLAGKKTAEEFGEPMRIGYLPDSFGHIPQMPQILNGFGIDNFIFTRGMPDDLPETGLEFIWNGPDGSKVLAVNQHLGYCNGGDLGYEHLWHLYRMGKPDFEIALKRVVDNLDTLKKYANTDKILFHNGCDHLRVQPELPDMLKYFESNLPGHSFIHSTFEKYIDSLKPDMQNFKEVSGELRGTKYEFLWPGVLTSRVYLKQRNWLNQMLLERQAEPVSSVVSLLTGKEYPGGFLDTAWKMLMKNHPHDSICGCSTDQVHREVEHRFDESTQIAAEVSHRYSHFLTNFMKTGRKKYPLLIWNGSGRCRSFEVHRLIMLPHEYLYKNYKMTGPCGKEIPFRINNRYPVFELEPRYLNSMVSYEEQKEHFLPYYSDYGLKSRKKAVSEVLDVSFFAEDVPGAGYSVFYLESSKNKFESTRNSGLYVNNSEIGNQFLSLKVFSNGTFDLTDKRTGIQYPGLNLFEDSEDIGDEYDYFSFKNTDRKFLKDFAGKVCITDNTPVSAAIEITGNFKLSSNVNKNREGRSKKTILSPVKITVSLGAGSKIASISVMIKNCSKDHRLRAWFPVGLESDKSYAGSQFCTVEREYGTPSPEGRRQFPVPTKPMYGFVALHNGKNGLAVFSRGLHEYEHVKQNKGSDALALTLYRSVGWIYRMENASKPIDLPPFYTPEAQCLKEMRFEYAIMPVSGREDVKNLDSYAWDYNTPPYVFTPSFVEQKKNNGSQAPYCYSFITINPKSIILTAVKKAEKNDNYIIRIYNSENNKITAELKFGKKPCKVYSVSLNEDRTGEPVLKNGILYVELDPYRIYTVEVEF